MAKKRINVPVKLRNRLFDEVQSKCPNPKCDKVGISTLEVHHMDGDPSNNDERNLLAICSNCHTEAEKGLISHADLDLWKRMLVSGYHPHPLAMGAPSRDRAGFNIGANYGQVAGTINNTVKQEKSTKGRVILPGSIGSDPGKYNYMEYLIKRLADFRSKGSSYGQKRKSKVHPGVVRSQIEKEWGGLPKDLPIDRFEALIESLKDKIDRTALGRNNRRRGIRNYHPIEEHGK
ncbi:HNH endonuclease [Puniceicoccaceae bacterium K14]|nr:HNH endonuclease [Puniceicoccaceae bacterium K14]